MNSNTIQALQEDACPSIRFRTTAEILGSDPCSEEMSTLQSQILQDPLVQEVFNWQDSSGWASSSFHGGQGIETAVRVLCEKGLMKGHPAIRGAMEALSSVPDIIYRGVGRPGRVLDAFGLGGSEMIRAALFAQAGRDAESGVKDQVEIALKGFDHLASVQHIRDVARRYKDKWVFQNDVMWPGIYHMRLLAFTHHWRSAENIQRVAEGVHRLADLSPIPDVYALHRSQLIAPCSFAMLNFNPQMAEMSGAEWMQWFHRMELCARMGIIPAVPQLHRQAQELKALLETSAGWFTRKITHPSFRQWGAYTGLALERDWRSPKRRTFDLTFRSLLILQR